MRKGFLGMSRSIWQLGLVIGCLLAVTVTMVACSSSMSGTTASGLGKVAVSISDPATCEAPDGPFSAVWVTITEVDANMSSTASNNGSGWVTLTPKNMAPTQINLLGQANPQCFLANLGDSLELQAGNYQQIRIKLAPTNPTGNPAGGNCGNYNNCVVEGTKTYPLQLSSEAQTGLKIPSGQISGGQFTIKPGMTNDLDIDFNTCMSIVQEGTGQSAQFRMKPVLRAGEASTTAVSMNGTVVDASGHGVSGAIVALEQPDGTDPNNNNVPIDRIVASERTNPDGTWDICSMLLQVDGDPTKPYDLVITGEDANGVQYAPSIVTGISMGETAGKITLNMAQGATAGTSIATITGQVDSTAGSSSAPGPAQAIDAYLSVLETINGVDYTIPVPAYAPQGGVSQMAGENIEMTTVATPTVGPACTSGDYDCYNYTLYTQSSPAYIGAWTNSGVTLNAQTITVPDTFVDGNASVAGSSTYSATCNPSEEISPAALTGSPLGVTGINLTFYGCSSTTP